MAHEIRALDNRTVDNLRTIIARDPIRYCYVASRLAQGGHGFLKHSYSDVIGYFDDGHLKSALLLGANVVPINTSSVARQEFARVLARQGRRCSSIVGQSEEVLDLWSLLNGAWSSAREVRANQPMMAISSKPLVAEDREVRFATKNDLDILMPACIDMFTGEVGVSPTAHGGGPAYRNRISELISERRSLVKVENNEVIFKAEVGAVGEGVAQIQGVWVKPEMRGQGIAAPAMAAVVKKVRTEIASTVSLYVNDFNLTALATYRRVGFEQVDTFATVLF
jgi:predicted GNAT family acetyltransferase